MIKNYSNSNYCVCCGDEIPEGRFVCLNCENGHYTHKKDKKSFFRKLLLLFSCSSLLFLCSCDASSQDFCIGGATFTCIEYNTGSGDHLFVHDQTGTLYVTRYAGYTFPLLNQDGTAYTLEQYTKDKGDAKVYRDAN